MIDYTKQLEEEIAALKGKLAECDWKAELFDRIIDIASINRHVNDFSKITPVEFSCGTDNELDRTIIEIVKKTKEERRKWWNALKDKQDPITKKFHNDIEDLKKYSNVLREQIYSGI